MKSQQLNYKKKKWYEKMLKTMITILNICCFPFQSFFCYNFLSKKFATYNNKIYFAINNTIKNLTKIRSCIKNENRRKRTICI